MAAVVAVETFLLVLLVVLVAGLLRSHAEILRRLGPEGAPAPGSVPEPPAARPAERRPAPPLAGASPAGDAVALDFARGSGQLTLLAFLTSGCGTCAGFWETLAEPRLPDGVQTVIVTRGSERESPARVAQLAPPDIPVVMSSEAWESYEVAGAPYFVLVSDAILGEGMAGTWAALASLVADAVAEERAVVPVVHRGSDLRARRIDATFAAAGIGPDHPSLYPAGRPEEAER